MTDTVPTTFAEAFETPVDPAESREQAVEWAVSLQGHLAQLEDLSAHLVYISRTVTASYPEGMDKELVFRRRVGKVGVEWGELQQAIEGYTGENPRKGTYGSSADVIKELLDCASSALAAVEFMTGDQGRALRMLAEQVSGQAERLKEALALGEDPEHSDPVREALSRIPGNCVGQRHHAGVPLDPSKTDHHGCIFIGAREGVAEVLSLAEVREALREGRDLPHGQQLPEGWQKDFDASGWKDSVQAQVGLPQKLTLAGNVFVGGSNCAIDMTPTVAESILAEAEAARGSKLCAACQLPASYAVHEPPYQSEKGAHRFIDRIVKGASLPPDPQFYLQTFDNPVKANEEYARIEEEMRRVGYDELSPRDRQWVDAFREWADTYRETREQPRRDES